MTIHDYVIDATGLDWSELLVHWHWLLPERYAVRMMTRFGDLFLELEDGSVHLFDVGRGKLHQVADDCDELADKLDTVENAESWLYSTLVDDLLDAGVACPDGHCYSFHRPPVLGGQHDVHNAYPLPIAQHYAFFAAIYHQIQDVPRTRRRKKRVSSKSASTSATRRKKK